jgi:lipid-A-disaccharide synthase
VACSVRRTRHRPRTGTLRDGYTAPLVASASSPLERRPRLLVSCGEASGDLYAAELVRELRALGRGAQVFGLGGDRMRDQGADLVAHVHDLAVVGLLEVVRHLPRIRRVFRALLARADAERPDIAVLVDYPDFNLRLARAMKRRGIPVVYYVSPQIWAWRGGRIRAIRETVERMIVIFPFEEALYREAGVPVTFVGHPLVDVVRPAADPVASAASLGLDPTRPVLAVLPGSRPAEVAHNIPPIAAALPLVTAQRPDVQAAVAVAPGLARAPFEALRTAGATLVDGRAHALVGAARAGIVASGTATVEATLLGLPMVVVYRLSPVTYALGKPFVRVPHYAMPNLIAGREVVRELIQGAFRPAAVAEETLALLADGPRREAVRAGLAVAWVRLGDGGASRRVAETLVRELDRLNKKS